MYITMQLSNGRGVQVRPHLPRDTLLGQHLWLDLYQLHSYGLAGALVQRHLKLHIIWKRPERERETKKRGKRQKMIQIGDAVAELQSQLYVTQQEQMEFMIGRLMPMDGGQQCYVMSA